ncbi:hypothetical protein [Pseudomonas abietaniphila]|uniref:hypothetical protein n=1 Tax=Pseudomonas abietaniphila TaxID=89065 RepID=UPI000A6DAFB5|nr:hypothetical protein [Pseudomonas abietaniphila]
MNVRAEMEEQRRNSLYAALNEKKRTLIDNPAFGVMVGVYHVAGQIKGSLDDAPLLPSPLERASASAGR